ncbi:MAG: lamin tail domain-containing protein, partial [Crocinitomicaceae bacterium]|nr:lamin tail domain-containing protein [Crocinitomicaceae bacterium]
MRTRNLFTKTLILLAFLTTNVIVEAQCSISVQPSNNVTINCGESIDLEAIGLSATPALSTDFNNFQLGVGWSTTATLQYNNPCSPSLDGTPSAWFGNVPLPRTLTTNQFDVACGGEICFDLDFGADDNNSNNCEDPDLPNEGVYIQYSVDGGVTWVDIFYFQPTPNKTGPYYSWANYCFTIPPGAWSSATQFRWDQPVATNVIFDHWGIDNVLITPASCGGTYDWSHIPGTNDPAITTVSPTTTTNYTVTFSDGLGNTCTEVVTVNVVGQADAGDPGSLTLCETASATDLFSVLNGSPDTGGTWTDVSGSGALSGSNFDPSVSGPGVYDFEYEVTNACGSDATLVTVTVNGAADAGTDGTLIICSGSAPTEAELFAALGGNPDPGGVWTGPIAGEYTYTVFAAAPCPSEDRAYVQVEQYEVLLDISATPILCNGGTSEVTVSATGGTAPYSGTGTFFETAGGPYTYMVSDASGCSVSQSISITEPMPLAITVTSAGIACSGGNLDVTVAATGGTAPYSGTGVFSEGSGTYAYFVTDANGCSASGGTTVYVEDLGVQINGDPVLCFGDTVDICAEIVTNDLFFSEYVEGSSLNKCIEIYNGTGSDIDLAAEGYTLDISFNGGSGTSSIALTGTIANGATYVLCDDGAAAAFLASADQTVTNSLWNGDDALTLSKSGVAIDIFGVIGNDPGSQWVSGANSTANSTLRRNADVNVGITSNPTGTGAGAFSSLESQWTSTSNNDASGLGSHSIITDGTVAWSTGATTDCISVSPTSAETYSVTYTSANGCTSTTSYTVAVPTPLVASISATSVDCNGGTADVAVSATGGTAPYTGIGVYSETAGTYDYTVTDANGCSEVVSITITEPTQLVVTVTSSGIACSGGTVDVTVAATGGTAPYIGTGVFNEGSGTYDYTVTDANGCSVTETITVYVEDLDVQINGAPVLCFGDTVDLCAEIITNELFFSEYVEGSSLNKCIEIYNGTGSDIDLAAEGYTLDISFNGGSGASSIALTGTIANGGTYVLCDDGAAAAFLVGADQTTTSSLWNGDDALTLSKSGVAVDIFGVIGDDPGSQWAGGANSTANSTLRRNASVNVGVISNPTGSGAGAFSSLESQWTSTSNNDASGLGSHSINTNGTIAWSTGDATDCISVSPTSAETYSVTFTSENGCTSTASYTVTVPTQLAASISATEILCNGETTDITVVASGGTAPYTGTGVYTESAGTYTYTVTDANGCSVDVTITVTEPTQLM